MRKVCTSLSILAILTLSDTLLEPVGTIKTHSASSLEILSSGQEVELVDEEEDEEEDHNLIQTDMDKPKKKKDKKKKDKKKKDKKDKKKKYKNKKRKLKVGYHGGYPTKDNIGCEPEYFSFPTYRDSRCSHRLPQDVPWDLRKKFEDVVLYNGCMRVG